jgi:hypothetical protein
MGIKQATHVVPGDKIEGSGGIFTVTDARPGIGDTVLLRGTVGGVATDWTSYNVLDMFDVVTVH